MNGSVAYFRQGGGVGTHTVLSYESANKSWSELPRCPNSDFCLAVVNNLLTAIGGRISRYGDYTNSLLSLTDMKWTEQFPPMPTKRWCTAVVCSGRSLVVAGGEGEGSGKKLSTVEVMDTETLYSGPQPAASHTHSAKRLQHSVETRFTCWGVGVRVANFLSQFSPVH